MAKGRPKTVAILREVILQHGEGTLDALSKFIAKHAETEDARMADVWERACIDLLDRIGLVPPKEPPLVVVNTGTQPAAAPTPELEDGLGPEGTIQ